MNRVKRVYEIDWLINRVYEESDKLNGRISDTSRFEERCIHSLSEYLEICEDNKRHKNKLVYLIKRAAKEALESYRKEETTVFSAVNSGDNRGEEKDGERDYEPVDVKTDVLSELIKKETIELLAQDDRRKRKILLSWATGNTNMTDISNTLARVIGGNAESHRKYIARFKDECKDIMRDYFDFTPVSQTG